MFDNQSPRILITRLSHIGDCVLTMPVACAIKSHFPRAFVAWAVERPSDQLLEGHPAVDHLIRVDRGYLKSLAVAGRVRKHIKSFRFDISIDSQSLTKSAALGWLAGIRHRIGFARSVGREFAPWMNTCRIQPQTDHLVDRSLELLRPLGIESAAVDFQVPACPAAEETVARFLRRTASGEFAVVNPGAGWPTKVWPARRYGEVARHLGQAWSIPSVVVWAGDQEREWAETIAAVSDGHAVLAPRTDLKELASFVRRATLFVGSDTGPLHLAAAVGTPCVSMYGPTLPKNCGPYGKEHIALQAYYQSGTNRERRFGDNTAMRAIQVATVCSACDQALSRHSAKRRRVA